MRAPTTLNNLIASSRIPGTVAVFVSNIAGRRVQDLPPESNFATFIATELVPWIRARYNVTVNPARAIIGGYSLGGLTAAYAGLRYSDVFGNVLSQSGSFWWAPDGTDATVEHNWMAKEFATRPKTASAVLYGRRHLRGAARSHCRKGTGELAASPRRPVSEGVRRPLPAVRGRT